MRLLRLTTVPEAYLADFFRRHPTVKRQPVSARMSAVLADHYAQAGSYSAALAKRGYDCHEVIVNLAQPSSERTGSAASRPQSREEMQRVAKDEVARLRPDIVWLNDFGVFDAEWIAWVRRSVQSGMRIYSWCGIEPQRIVDLDGPDCILTSSRHLAARFRAGGLHVAVVPFAFDPQVLTQLTPRVEASLGVSFVGSVRRANGFHEARARVIEALAETVGIEVYSSAGDVSDLRRVAAWLAAELRPVARGLSADAIARRFRLPWVERLSGLADEGTWTKSHPVWATVRPSVYGLRMYDVLHQSLVALNVHADCTGPMTGNIRLFEATGVGTCLLTDTKDDLADFFLLEKEVVTFDSPAECVEKARWLCDNPVAARRIGQAGQARVLASHTYDHRAEMLDRLFQSSAKS